MRQFKSLFYFYWEISHVIVAFILFVYINIYRLYLMQKKDFLLWNEKEFDIVKYVLYSLECDIKLQNNASSCGIWETTTDCEIQLTVIYSLHFSEYTITIGMPLVTYPYLNTHI